MARYQLALLAVILLFLLQDGLCYKNKHEHKKNKENKYKNKVSSEIKNHNHKNHHHHYYRQTRSAEEEKYKTEVDENAEEKVPYVVERSRKNGRMIEESVNECESSCPKRNPKSCSKRLENGLAEKKKKKTCYVMVDEETGMGEMQERPKMKRREIDSTSAVTPKKMKTVKKKQTYAVVEEEEPELAPEDIEYKVIVNKKPKRRIMPTYIYVDETNEDGGLEETFTGKSLKKKSANYIIESIEDSELENKTGRRYILEDMLEPTIEEQGNGLDDEEENELL